MPTKKNKQDGRPAEKEHWNIPKHELESLARCFLPDILAFFESEERQREYEEWKKQQAEKKQAG